MVNSPESFLSAFADFIKQHHSTTLYIYAGYTGFAGALLLKVKDSDRRVSIRPWLRGQPVGLTDIQRSDRRYGTFRGQSPDIHVHVASRFRDNALRNAQRGGSSALIAFDPKRRTVSIAGSISIPKVLLDVLLAFCTVCELTATYDFSGTLIHRASKRGEAQIDRAVRSPPNPSLFLSYSWDSEAHKKWVLKLAADLIRNGVRVLVDEWDLRDYNDDLHFFMETGIRESDHVVLICTPTYAKRANDRKGGVGVESTIITGVFYDSTKASKFIAITRAPKGGIQHSLPTYLKSRFAIDFTEDSSYQSKLGELLRRVFNQPRYRRPELGPPPRLGTEDI